MRTSPTKPVTHLATANNSRTACGSRGPGTTSTVDNSKVDCPGCLAAAAAPVRKVYGHTAVVRRYVPGTASDSGLGAEVAEIEIKRKGSRATIERAARLTPGFIEVVKIEDYSEAEWVRCFGRGRM